MVICKLVHFEKKLSVEFTVSKAFSVEKIKQLWKYKYGKLFYECEFIVVGTIKNKKYKKVINCITGDIYETISDAANAMGLTETTINNHCNKKAHIYGRPGSHWVKFGD